MKTLQFWINTTYYCIRFKKHSTEVFVDGEWLYSTDPIKMGVEVLVGLISTIHLIIPNIHLITVHAGKIRRKQIKQIYKELITDADWSVKNEI